jgi:hypothetical protein
LAKSPPPGIGVGIGSRSRQSASTRRVVEWMRQRALLRQEEVMKARAKENATVVLAEALIGNDNDNFNVKRSDGEAQDAVDPINKDTATLPRGQASDDKDDSETDVADGQATNNEIEPHPATETRGDDQLPTASLDDVNTEYETERRLLLENNKNELAAFDQVTASMIEALWTEDGDKDGSTTDQPEAIQERHEARTKMKRYHKAQVGRLAVEYGKKADGNGKSDNSGDIHVEQITNNNGQDANDDNDLPLTSSEDQDHPLAASCRVVSRIAAELMKLLLETKLYHGGRLVGDAVSLYMKERARVHDKKMASQRRMLQWEDPLALLFSTQAPTYDGVSY